MNRHFRVRSVGRDSSPKRPLRGAASARWRPSSLLRRLAAEEDGSAIVFTLGVFLFLFVLVLSVYSVGETIRRKEELQNACDAAAYSAAEVQADVLSRMAVLNRAMAWTYVQTSKMQMDYITYKWLRRVRDCFRDDKRHNVDQDEKWEFGTPEMGYRHLSKDFQDYNGTWMSIHFSCHDHIHDDPSKAQAHYIGLGPNNEGGLNTVGQVVGGLSGGAVGAADKHWIRINGFDENKKCLRYNEGTGDLDLVENGSPTKRNLVESLGASFGGNVVNLGNAIANGKKTVDFCNAMLVAAGNPETMGNAMRAAARAALLANMPRRPDGTLDPKAVSDYAYTIVPGVSAEAAPYPAGAAKGYFDPLRNCEEDEMRFLAMANGLAADDGTAVLGTDVKLRDFFRSAGVENGDLAAGLDQWFVRCDPDEFRKDKVGVQRHFVPPPGGIQRCYKTANYVEGRTKEGILRGNYCFDGGARKTPQTPDDFECMPPGTSALYLMNATQPPPPGPSWRRALIYARLLPRVWQEHSRVLSMENSARSRLRLLYEQTPYRLFSVFARYVNPSCVNLRGRFVDKCANVSETIGLVAEYEWASAYWFCCWFEFKRHPQMGGSLIPLNSAHRPLCVHIPLPSAVFGGWDSWSSYGSSPEAIARKQDEMYRSSGKKDPQISKQVSGWSRNDYRRTFIGPDAEEVYECKFPLQSNGANMGAKGYVRIYGDDREIVDECYVGPKCMPWLLNRRFFNGAGTTVVAVARRQRNVFDRLFGDDGIFDAFTPDRRDGKGKSVSMPNVVAISAARAAWAPRSGKGIGNGPDSVNNPEYGVWGGKWGRHYELRYDSVTDGVEGNFKPELHPDFPNAEAVARQSRVGCVCGDGKTGSRLARQWNLCQTDWDAVLLPVRHALANPGRDYDSGDDPDAVSTWSHPSDGSGRDPQAELVHKTLAEIGWLRFSENGGDEREPETFESVFLAPQGMEESDAYRLFKKRMIH